jgi:hypothetical protein
MFHASSARRVFNSVTQKEYEMAKDTVVSETKAPIVLGYIGARRLDGSDIEAIICDDVAFQESPELAYQDFLDSYETPPAVIVEVTITKILKPTVSFE